MTSNQIGISSRRGRKFELLLATSFVALFAYAVADLLHIWPGEQGFQPLRLVLMTGALALQPLASLVQPRSRLVFYLLLGISCVLIGTAVFVVDG